MSISKQEMIDSIFKRYGVRFGIETKEKDLINIFAGKYSRVEVVNKFKRGDFGKFDEHDINFVSTGDLSRLVSKYRKRPVPPGASRELVIKILLKKLNPDKLSDKELTLFGKMARGGLVGGLSLYGGLIPGVKKSVEQGDIERGKKEVRRYQ